MTTIRDIARSAGVSVSTASLALNGDQRVRLPTRERVLAAAAALDYHPSLAARALSRGRTWSIQLLYPASGTMASGFFSRFVTGLHDGARERGTNLALAVPFDAEEAVQTLTRMIRERWSDGVVFMNLDDDAALPSIAREHGFPHVVIGRAGDPEVPSVDNDNVLVAGDVARFLIAKGARHALLLNGRDDSFFTRERAEGFRAALEDAGHGDAGASVVFTDGRLESAQRAVHGWLDAGRPLDAVAAVSDALAVAAIQALAQRGLRVPHDVRVCGMNNDDIARFVTPSLSSVDLRAAELGLAAARLLLDQVEGVPIQEVRRLVGHEIVERETTT